MNFKDYQEKAQRTSPNLGSIEINLAHMVLGMGSELNELVDAVSKNDHINISEEIADIFWYLANYCTFQDYSLYYIWEMKNVINITEDQTPLFYGISKLQDLVKKNLAYKKEINKLDEFEILRKICYSLDLEIKERYININSILENNINKLLVRFPIEFTTEKAINRDLQAEHIQLSK